jgi:vancomycin permeability regulator SanA
MQKLKALLARLWRRPRQHPYSVIIIVLAGVLIVFGPIAYTFAATRGERYESTTTPYAQIPFHQAAIVFGAGITEQGKPTPYLQSRIETAAALYKNHRVNILLMSGDNSTKEHNEPIIMKNYAIKLGVPAKSIVVDDAGFNTYDSCYRAHAIFGLNNATLVSQDYHLPRAITTCQGLGIQNIGVVAIHSQRDFTNNYLAREVVSTDKMVWQLIFKPHPTALGKPLPIKQ